MATTRKVTGNEKRLSNFEDELVKIKLEAVKNEAQQTERLLKSKSELKKLYASILIAIGGVIMAILTIIVQNNNTLRHEEKKLRSELILKSFETGDTTETKKRLLFFVNVKLIEDKDSLITKSAKQGRNLPSQAYFNTESVVPTVTLSNNINHCAPGSVDGCWVQAITGYAGDVITVQIFFTNNSPVASLNTVLTILPKRTGFNEITFNGVVLSTDSRTGHGSGGAATLRIKHQRDLKIGYLVKSARWYAGGSTPIFVDADELFDLEGFNIGTVPAGATGYLLADFLIGVQDN